MGRALMNQAPLDNYRKQIGQQANRIDKRHHKEKVKVQGARVRQDGALWHGLRVIAAVLSALGLVYVLVMIAISGSSRLVLVTVAGLDAIAFLVFAAINVLGGWSSRRPTSSITEE